MQKINHIHYVLLILGLSCAPVMKALSPESLAAALNFCQERFNTSDQEKCLTLVEARSLENLKETMTIITTNPLNPDHARLAELEAESRALNKYIPALRNDEQTAEELLKKYTRSTIENLKRCNADTDVTNLSSCVTNGVLDDIKAFLNTPDAIRASKRPASLALLYDAAVFGEKTLELEIERRKANPTDMANDLVSTDMLQELLQQITTARTNLANAFRSAAHKNNDTTEIVTDEGNNQTTKNAEQE